MIRYPKTFEVIFSTNNLSGMHISTMWHSLNVYKYFCPLSVQCNLYKWGAWDGQNLNCPPFPGYNFQLDKHYIWSYYTIYTYNTRINVRSS